MSTPSEDAVKELKREVLSFLSAVRGTGKPGCWCPVRWAALNHSHTEQCERARKMHDRLSKELLPTHNRVEYCPFCGARREDITSGSYGFECSCGEQFRVVSLCNY